MSAGISGPRQTSYLVMLGVLIGVARFNLGPCLLAGLVAYMILDTTERRLHEAKAGARIARWAAVAAFVVVATALVWIIVKFLRVGVVRLPVLLDSVLPRLAAFAETYGFDFPVDNAKELRDLAVAAAHEHTSSIGKTSGLLTHGFFQIAVGVFAAVARFLTPSPAGHAGHLYDSVRHQINDRVTLFMRSFERVVGAQLAISAINTVLTAVFLYAMGVPFKTFLMLTTFVCGLVPILGNVISNAAIVSAGLTVSLQLAMFGLIYLVVIHKLEYFLNSRIIGGSIDTPMWMTLLGIVVGEAVMGVPGVLLAPALLHYAREEMRAIPSKG